MTPDVRGVRLPPDLPGLCDFCRWKPRECRMADTTTAVRTCFEARQSYRETVGPVPFAPFRGVPMR